MTFVPAIAYHLCLNLLAAFSQPHASHLRAPSRKPGSKYAERRSEPVYSAPPSTHFLLAVLWLLHPSFVDCVIKPDPDWQVHAAHRLASLGHGHGHAHIRTMRLITPALPLVPTLGPIHRQGCGRHYSVAQKILAFF